MAKVKLFAGITIPTGAPGKLPCGSSYRQLIRINLRKKYGVDTPYSSEMKTLWNTKHATARSKKAQILWDRQNGQCIFCNKETSLKKRKTGKGALMATLDHILPQGQGGTDHLSNLVIACSACNMARGSIDFFVFAEMRWSTSEKIFQATLRNYRNKLYNKDKQERDAAKRTTRRGFAIYGIAVLLYLRPEWNTVVEQVKENFLKEREQRQIRRDLKKKRQAELQERAALELARLAPHASPSVLPVLPSGSHDPALLAAQQSCPVVHYQP